MEHRPISSKLRTAQGGRKPFSSEKAQSVEDGQRPCRDKKAPTVFDLESPPLRDIEGIDLLKA